MLLPIDEIDALFSLCRGEDIKVSISEITHSFSAEKIIENTDTIDTFCEFLPEILRLYKEFIYDDSIREICKSAVEQMILLKKALNELEKGIIDI